MTMTLYSFVWPSCHCIPVSHVLRKAVAVCSLSLLNMIGVLYFLHHFALYLLNNSIRVRVRLCPFRCWSISASIRPTILNDNLSDIIPHSILPYCLKPSPQLSASVFAIQTNQINETALRRNQFTISTWGDSFRTACFLLSFFLWIDIIISIIVFFVVGRLRSSEQEIAPCSLPSARPTPNPNLLPNLKTKQKQKRKKKYSKVDEKSHTRGVLSAIRIGCGGVWRLERVVLVRYECGLKHICRDVLFLRQR